jgi:hypothetical protein
LRLGIRLLIRDRFQRRFHCRCASRARQGTRVAASRAGRRRICEAGGDRQVPR